MANNKKLTMEYVGKDFWDNLVYKCLETGVLYKVILGDFESHTLYNCCNDYDGEPGWPLNDDVEIQFVSKYNKKDDEYALQYGMLDRLKSDCDYYLGNGNRCKGHLWASDEKSQIEEMKKLFREFPDDKKPEWLRWEQILEYEYAMC